MPSSEAYVRAAVMGWGVGVAPEIQIRPWVASGDLVVLQPEVSVDVALYWHQWQLQGRDALLDRIGQALAKGLAWRWPDQGRAGAEAAAAGAWATITAELPCSGRMAWAIHNVLASTTAIRPAASQVNRFELIRKPGLGWRTA